VLLPSVVVAFGLGFSFVPLIIAATAGVTGRDAGLASGLINTSQQIGGALGLAVLSTIATSRITSHLAGLQHAPTPADVAQASVNGYTAAFAVGAAFAFVGAIVAVFVLRISVTETRAAAEHGGMPV
jgi:MFS family permease